MADCLSQLHVPGCLGQLRGQIRVGAPPGLQGRGTCSPLEAEGGHKAPPAPVSQGSCVCELTPPSHTVAAPQTRSGWAGRERCGPAGAT